MTDQQRFDSLGCYGNPVAHTPFLDALAEESVVFDAAYSTCPACIPARGTCLTGLNQWHLGSLTYKAPLKQEYPVTIPKLLREEGYSCVAVGKNHFQPQRAMHGYDKIYLDESGRVESPGFVSDYMQWFEEQTGHRRILAEGMDFNGYTARPYPYDERLHPTAWVRETGLAALDRLCGGGEPFFLKLSFARPHSPYDAPKRWFDWYDALELPAPYLAARDRKNKRVRGGRLTRWRGKASPEEVHAARAGYMGNVSFIDEAVGAVLERLRQQGIYDDTMILFTSDHGDMLGDHNLWRKCYAYEGSAHIPLLIKPPKGYGCGLLPGSCAAAPAALYDLMRTILSAVNPQAAFPTDGIDLLHETRELLHGEYIQGYAPEMDMQFLTDGALKWIWYMRTGKCELYHTQSDPGELHDLSRDQAFQAQMDRF